ncbi:peptide ABC transporter substrate-binding protein [Candidatus Heimdallarchaeota archaeon B3_Heim]|nr:MAG: peptide ABC transporter substrate-binding protein [Candidatus Heimdallarchaeota archaeon B3_Heim]
MSSLQLKEGMNMIESSESGNIIEVKNLKMYFQIAKSLFSSDTLTLRAVDDISFSIKKGATLGLVGESGCGKTTAARCILRLYESTDGQIIFEGRDITKLKGRKLRQLRKDMQIIFQDPYSSLDPRMSVGDIIGEPLVVHGVANATERSEIVFNLLKTVGLAPDHFYRFPHEFSGGQRQRIGVARALALNPRFIVADEPVSALDVSIQAQILNLLQDLQKEFNLTYLVVAHDLGVVRHLTQEVAVMYVGKIVEKAPTEELFHSPSHPYTEALISAVPSLNLKRKMNRLVLRGDVPSPVFPPPGCRFSTRCMYAKAICSQKEPPLEEIAPDHFVACHFPLEETAYKF